MKRKTTLQNFLLYRHRYMIVIFIVAVIALFVASYKFWLIPSGLTSEEISSAEHSGWLTFHSLLSSDGSIIGLPWYGLQAVSLKLFGVSVFSLRLPAVILMLLSTLLMARLLQRLTRPNVAVIGTLLMITSTFYASASRSGTPVAMTIFLTTTALLIGYTLLNQSSSLKKTLRITLTAFLALVVAMLLYLPGGLYVVLTLAIIALLHPRIRLLVKDHRLTYTIVAVAILILALPLAMQLLSGAGRDAFVKQLLLIGIGWSFNNVGTFFQALVGIRMTDACGLVAPMLTLVGAIICLIGLRPLIHSLASIRTYVVIASFVIVLLLCGFTQSAVFLFYVPSVILLTFGIAALNDQWYKLFPRNPYARTFAVVPMAVLIISLAWLNLGRYFDAVSYNKTVAYQYDATFTALSGYLSDNKDKSITLVVNDSQTKLYSLFIRNYNELSVVNQYPTTASHNVIVLASYGGVKPQALDARSPKRISTSWHQNDSVLFRIY